MSASGARLRCRCMQVQVVDALSLVQESVVIDAFAKHCLQVRILRYESEVLNTSVRFLELRQRDLFVRSPRPNPPSGGSEPM